MNVPFIRIPKNRGLCPETEPPEPERMGPNKVATFSVLMVLLGLTAKTIYVALQMHKHTLNNPDVTLAWLIVNWIALAIAYLFCYHCQEWFGVLFLFAVLLLSEWTPP